MEKQVTLQLSKVHLKTLEEWADETELEENDIISRVMTMVLDCKKEEAQFVGVTPDEMVEN